jgi:hypothetical protein
MKEMVYDRLIVKMSSFHYAFPLSFPRDLKKDIAANFYSPKYTSTNAVLPALG